METRLLVLENRLRQTEEALVAERRASRRTAEVAQQVVRTCPAGVDVEEIGRLEMFSGDSDLNSRVNSMPWSQWSLTVDPVAAAGGNKRGRSDHRRQHYDDRSGETTFNATVLCACTDLQEESAASVPTSFQRLRVCGMETAMQEIWTASSSEIPWNAPSPLSSTKSVELKWLVRQWRNRVKVCNEQPGNEESNAQQNRRRGIVLVRKRPSSSEQDRRVRCLKCEPHRTGVVG